MSLQQSFHPLLSNAALYDRMFRYKPYTKCIDCLSNDKLKCRKCMQNIIQEISKNDGPKKTTIRIRDGSKLSSKFTQFKNEQMTKCKSVHRRKKVNHDKENVMITSKYNWWLAERIKKRQSDLDMKGTWPRKARSDVSNFDKFGVKKPKFEKWEKKLLDKFQQRKQNTEQ